MTESAVSFLDFDAAWTEHRARPFTVTVPADEGSEFAGDEVPMPASMPAGFRLHVFRVRLEHGLDHDLTDVELQVAASFLFGEHRVAAWLRARISDATLTKAVQDALAIYSIREPWRSPQDGDGAGKARPPVSEALPT